MLCRFRNAPCLYRSWRNNTTFRYSDSAVLGFVESIPARPNGASAFRLGISDGILPLFREPRRTACTLPEQLSRRGTPKVVRFHVHCFAVGEFLAGCRAGP